MSGVLGGAASGDTFYCGYCNQRRSPAFPADNDELAKNKLLSGEPCHPPQPRSGVWVSYHVDWSGWTIWATEYEALSAAVDNGCHVGYLKFGAHRSEITRHKEEAAE